MRTDDRSPQTMHICMITDDNYVLPTKVAIQSVSDAAKRPCVLHLITSALSAETEADFNAFNETLPNVTIAIHRENAGERFQNFHTYEKDGICVASIAALLKFLIPEIYPELDKMLYLDGDLIVVKDLEELYDTELGGHYAATVAESGTMYYRHSIVNDVAWYFNSGVMLLNLKKMREDHLSEKLIEMKRTSTDNKLMDQNVFNLAFDGHLVHLPIRFNFMPVSLLRANAKWTVEDVNKLYGTSYATKTELAADAAIVHYSSKDKPWKAPDGAFHHLWQHAWLRSVGKQPEKPEGVPAVSVVMPCYNVEGYVAQTLDCLLTQTLGDTEIICIDDGSKDGTLGVLRRYEQLDSRVRVIADSNHHQGYQRNHGIAEAKGEIVYFMDSDDLIEPDTLELVYRTMTENSLDLIYFQGTSFFESRKLEEEFPQYKTTYQRKDWYPAITTGEEMFIRMRENGDWIISPCMQAVRRSLLADQPELRFPEMTMYEDNLYVLKAALAAKRAVCLPQSLYLRRVQEGSTMTGGSGDGKELRSLAYLIGETARLYAATADKPGLHHALGVQVRSHIKNFASRCDPEDASTLAGADETVWPLAGMMLYREVYEEKDRRRLERIDQLREDKGHYMWKARNLEKRLDEKTEEVRLVRASHSYRLGNMLINIPKKLLKPFRRG